MSREQLPKAGSIFEGGSHAGVVQDKSEPSSERTASDQAHRAEDELRLNHNGVRLTSTIPTDEVRLNQPYQTDEFGSTHAYRNSRARGSLAAVPQAPSITPNPSHLGSASEPLVPLTTQIRRSLKEEIQRIAKQEDMSDSATAAAFLEKAIQGNIDMQYGAMLKPVIEATIDRRIKAASTRTANLALEAFYAAEEGRIITIYTLRFLLGSDIDLLPQIINEARGQARESLKRYAYAEEEEEKEINN